MTKVGKISSLFYVPSSGHTQINTLDLNRKGIINHKHYNKDIDRSVLITSMLSYELIKLNDIDVEYGILGENILMDYNPYHLKSGDRLSIGNVVLEISQNCTLCKSCSCKCKRFLSRYRWTKRS